MVDTHYETSNNETYNSNITLSYEYVEKTIAHVRNNIDVLNNRLALLIGFNASLIRFSPGLPDRSLKNSICVNETVSSLSCNSCLLFKVLCCAFLTISIAICLWGLSPEKTKDIIPPKELIDKASLNSEINFKLAIITTWDTILKNLYKVKDKKSNCLVWAICFLGFASLMSALDIIIASLFN